MSHTIASYHLLLQDMLVLQGLLDVLPQLERRQSLLPQCPVAGVEVAAHRQRSGQAQRCVSLKKKSAQFSMSIKSQVRTLPLEPGVPYYVSELHFYSAGSVRTCSSQENVVNGNCWSLVDGSPDAIDCDFTANDLPTGLCGAAKAICEHPIIQTEDEDDRRLSRSLSTFI